MTAKRRSNILKICRRELWKKRANYLFESSYFFFGTMLIVYGLLESFL